MEEKQKPVKSFKAKLIEVSVWKSEKVNKEGHTFDAVSVAMKRNYKDGDEWKTTYNLNAKDVPVAIALLQKAHEYILLGD